MTGESDSLGKEVYRYIRLATLISEAASKQGFFEFTGRGCVGGEGWSGRSGMIQGFRAWICFDARLWSNHGRSPIWIEFDEEKRSDVRLKRLLPKLQESFDCLTDSPHVDPMLAIPIRVPDTVEERVIIDKAVFEISQIFLALAEG